MRFDRAIDTLQQQYPNSALYALHDQQDADFLAWCARQSLPTELQHSAAKRQHEFLAGRYAAAKALQQLGLPELHLINRQPDGQAAWPTGYTGSISHHGGMAVAWVAPCGAYTQLGLDLEAIVGDARAQKLQTRTLHRAEIQLGQQFGYPPALWFTLLFSCKETIYKLLSSQAGRVMPFLSVQIIAVHPDAGDRPYVDMLRLTCRLTEDWSTVWRCDAELSLSALLLADHSEPRWVLSAAALPTHPLSTERCA